MMSRFLVLFALISLLASCGGNTDVEVGKKTTMSVNKVFDGGEVILGEKVDAVFTIKNTGDYPLVVSAAKPTCGCTVVDEPEDAIMPGDTYDIRSYVNTDNVGIGTLRKTITITANTEPASTVVTVQALVKNK